MTPNQVAKKFRAEYLKGYQVQPKRIMHDYNAAEENRTEYAGREILELLQNAIDQKDPNSSAPQKIELKLDGNILSISNTGLPFNGDGIESIMMPNISQKRNKPEFIGNKGLGFRSILNWAEEIRIFSTKLSVCFSEKIAHDFFARQGITEPTAILVAPEIIPERDLGVFVTMIEVVVSDESLELIELQLAAITAETFLFIEGFDNLVVNNNGKIRFFSRHQNPRNHKVIISETKDDETTEKAFEFYSETGKIGEKGYQLAVAYPEFESNPANHRLYSFLPTDVAFPIRWLCHGTFDLTSNRDALTKTSENVILLKKLISLIRSSAEKLKAHSSEQPRWTKLYSIMSSGDFGNNLNMNGFNFLDEYKSVMHGAKVVPLMSRGYISAPEAQYLVRNFEKYIDPLPNLAFYSTDETTDNWIWNNGASRVSAEDISRAITHKFRQNSFTISERADCIKQFLEEFGSNPDDYPSGVLLDDHSRPVMNGSLYLQPFSGEKFNLPKFTTLRLINPELQDALLEKFDSNAQTMTEKLAAFNVRPYDPSEIIENITSRLQEKPELFPEYLDWFWHSRESEIVQHEDFSLILKNKSGILRPADELYFGEEYGSEFHYNSVFYDDNSLLAKLLPPHDVPESKWQDFLTTSSLIDVNHSPNFKEVEIDDEDYYNYIIDHLDYSRLLRNRYKSDIDSAHEFRKAYPSIRLSHPAETLLGFADFLKTSSTKEVIALLRYFELVGLNLFRKDFPNSFYPTNHTSTIFTNPTLPSYLFYLVRHTPWIEFKGQKYSPDQVILYDALQNRASGLLGISLEQLYENLGLDREDWRDLKQDLALAEHFTDLTSAQIYSLLDELPKIESRNGSISRKLYNDLIQPNNTLVPDPELRENFISSGQLFCQDQSFHPAKNVYYSRQYLQNNLCAAYNLNFIHIPSRRNAKLISTWLGASPKDIRLEISGTPILHRLDRDFQLDWEDLRIGILALRWGDCSTDADRSLVKRLKINLVSRADVSIDEQPHRLEDFSFASKLKSRSEYYLAIPDSYISLDQLRRNINFRKAIGELISEIFDINNELIIKDIYALINEDDRAEYIQKNDNSFWYDAKDYLDGKKSSDLVDFTAENLGNLRRLCEQKLAHFKDVLYENLLSDPERQPEWNNLISEFENFTPDSDVDFSSALWSQDNLLELLTTAFPLLNNSADSSYEDNYNVHRRNLLARLAGYSQADIFANINNSLKLETFLRFGRIDELVELLEPRLTKEKSTPEQKVDDLKTDVEIEVVSPAEFQSPEPPIISGEPSPTPTPNSDPVSPHPRKHTSRPAPTSRRISESNARRVAAGLRAEEHALASLRKDFPSAKITWCSGYAKDRGDNLDAADGLGYDIKLELSGQVIYIEVKSFTPGGAIKFPMSANELDFAIKHADHYWIYLVENSDNSKVHILPLKQLFASPENYLREDQTSYVIAPKIKPAC